MASVVADGLSLYTVSCDVLKIAAVYCSRTLQVCRFLTALSGTIGKKAGFPETEVYHEAYQIKSSSPVSFQIASMK